MPSTYSPDEMTAFFEKRNNEDQMALDEEHADEEDSEDHDISHDIHEHEEHHESLESQLAQKVTELDALREQIESSAPEALRYARNLFPKPGEAMKLRDGIIAIENYEKMLTLILNSTEDRYKNINKEDVQKMLTLITEIKELIVQIDTKNIDDKSLFMDDALNRPTMEQIDNEEVEALNEREATLKKLYAELGAPHGPVSDQFRIDTSHAIYEEIIGKLDTRITTLKKKIELYKKALDERESEYTNLETEQGAAQDLANTSTDPNERRAASQKYTELTNRMFRLHIVIEGLKYRVKHCTELLESLNKSYEKILSSKSNLGDNPTLDEVEAHMSDIQSTLDEAEEMINPKAKEHGHGHEHGHHHEGILSKIARYSSYSGGFFVGMLSIFGNYLWNELSGKTASSGHGGGGHGGGHGHH